MTTAYMTNGVFTPDVNKVLNASDSNRHPVVRMNGSGVWKI